MSNVHSGSSLYINRELSWLAFNGRVLHEALDPRVPLLERVKFLGIFSANLDEFYMVRIAGLKRRRQAGQATCVRCQRRGIQLNDHADQLVVACSWLILTRAAIPWLVEAELRDCNRRTRGYAH